VCGDVWRLSVLETWLLCWDNDAYAGVIILKDRFLLPRGRKTNRVRYTKIIINFLSILFITDYSLLNIEGLVKNLTLRTSHNITY